MLAPHSTKTQQNKAMERRSVNRGCVRFGALLLFLAKQRRIEKKICNAPNQKHKNVCALQGKQKGHPTNFFCSTHFPCLLFVHDLTSRQARTTSRFGNCLLFFSNTFRVACVGSFPFVLFVFAWQAQTVLRRWAVELPWLLLLWLLGCFCFLTARQWPLRSERGERASHRAI